MVENFSSHIRSIAASAALLTLSCNQAFSEATNTADTIHDAKRIGCFTGVDSLDPSGENIEQLHTPHKPDLFRNKPLSELLDWSIDITAVDDVASVFFEDFEIARNISGGRYYLFATLEASFISAMQNGDLKQVGKIKKYIDQIYSLMKILLFLYLIVIY